MGLGSILTAAGQILGPLALFGLFGRGRRPSVDPRLVDMAQKWGKGYEDLLNFQREIVFRLLSTPMVAAILGGVDPVTAFQFLSRFREEVFPGITRGDLVLLNPDSPLAQILLPPIGKSKREER